MASKKKDSKLGWHFLPSDMVLGYSDGRKAEVGKTLEYSGTPSLCNSGMHASERPSHAAAYTKGPVLCRVLVSGQLQEGSDKMCGRKRKVLWAKELSVKDLRAACKAAGKTHYSDQDKDTLVATMGSVGGNRKLDAFLAGWARANGCSDASPDAYEKPELDEKAVLSVLMPRVIRSKKEILRDLGKYYALESDDYDDLFDEVVTSSVKVGIADNFDPKTGDDGYYLRG